ncbi:MAG: hypothetical protein IJV00_03420 [Clostridia bacterium]|nr:hypothetical protein [Clostridia bacterium]
MEFKDYLEQKVREIISKWRSKGIYAISFFVYYNESNAYKSVKKNFPEFKLMFNTLDKLEDPKINSEEKWNPAFWTGEDYPIVDYTDAVEGAEELLKWFDEIGVKNPGKDRKEKEYDDYMNYIGKGPYGFYEFLGLVSEVAAKLQTDGTIKAKFGDIPLLVNGLEECWYYEEATLKANPGGEAKEYLDYFGSPLFNPESDKPIDEQLEKNINAFADRMWNDGAPVTPEMRGMLLDVMKLMGEAPKSHEDVERELLEGTIGSLVDFVIGRSHSLLKKESKKRGVPFKKFQKEQLEDIVRITERFGYTIDELFRYDQLSLEHVKKLLGRED